MQCVVYFIPTALIILTSLWEHSSVCDLRWQSFVLELFLAAGVGGPELSEMRARFLQVLAEHGRSIGFCDRMVIL